MAQEPRSLRVTRGPSSYRQASGQDQRLLPTKLPEGRSRAATPLSRVATYTYDANNSQSGASPPKDGLADIWFRRTRTSETEEDKAAGVGGSARNGRRDLSGVVPLLGLLAPITLRPYEQETWATQGGSDTKMVSDQ